MRLQKKMSKGVELFNPNWSLEFSPFNFLMTAIRECCLYTVVYQ